MGGILHIHIVAVGKIKEKFLQMGIEEYKKRLTSYAGLEITEVKEEQVPEELSAKEEEQVKDREGERILAHLRSDERVVSLAIPGKPFSSEELAKYLDDAATYGRSRIAFIIGGSLGLSGKVLARSDLLLSFSKMTFPHQLMRLILLEQLYRACKINRGEPYHK
ncbi:MAG: 23S rRNA (pseudouridine(1915)-N(3))-methyltransferase RlmH [Thermicanus sp.]|nr:23S rRNA (pseudouridine(1915)-N(3))-methyltransferase RlmH [Thermicanus sp.]